MKRFSPERFGVVLVALIELAADGIVTLIELAADGIDYVMTTPLFWRHRLRLPPEEATQIVAIFFSSLLLRHASRFLDSLRYRRSAFLPESVRLGP